jgi:hypothetical protein
MIRKRGILVAALLVLFGTGCFEVEQSIELKRDLSGTANFKLGIDMEPMILIMAKMQKEMGGDKTPLTAAELAAAKADFKKSQKTTTSSSKSEDPRKEAEAGLPPGVKLLGVAVDEKEFGVTTNMKFAFDKLSSLVGVKLNSKKEANPDPTKKSVIDSPFEGLELSETANTITIHTKPQNPAEKVTAEASEQGGPKMDAETEKMMNDAFKNMRVAWKITAPFEVVSSNATRKEGNTLIWEYDFQRLQKLGTSKKGLDDMGVNVVYKK